jgi:hypothetical protein
MHLQYFSLTMMIFPNIGMPALLNRASASLWSAEEQRGFFGAEEDV